MIRCISMSVNVEEDSTRVFDSRRLLKGCTTLLFCGCPWLLRQVVSSISLSSSASSVSEPFKSSDPVSRDRITSPDETTRRGEMGERKCERIY